MIFADSFKLTATLFARCFSAIARSVMIFAVNSFVFSCVASSFSAIARSVMIFATDIYDRRRALDEGFSAIARSVMIFAAIATS